MGTQDRIQELEAELKKTKYNKKTQSSIGILKAKIAQLKEKQTSRKGPATSGYAVSKTGDATVILVGFPSVGKSTLLNTLTGTRSEVAAYEFTTLTVIPGLLKYKGTKIQILDVPGIVEGAASGRGRGKEVLQMARNADLVILLLDVFHPEHHEVLQHEVEETGVRINQRKPQVSIVKKERGGLDIGTTVKLTNIDRDTIAAVLKEFRINNAQIVIRDNITTEQLIDVLEGNKKYVPAITVINKIDLVSPEKAKDVMQKTKADLAVSGTKETNIAELKELIFRRLEMIRIYTKEARKQADKTEPLIMHSNSTIRDVCMKLHKDFVIKFKFSRIWGKSAKFPGQKQGLDHRIADGDVIEIHVR
jgi:small GTP-binding protein